jgi:crotonobetainyl-CoA:carnitine CoA-transferase CaiB-like acyl-CoA transferase
MWKRLLEIMGFDDLARDADFTAPMWTSPQSSERLELFQMWSKDRAVDEVVETLQGNRVPCAPVKTIAEVLDDPHLSERGTMVELPVDEEGRRMLVSTSPIKMPEAVAAMQEVPRLGQHNVEILTELLGLEGRTKSGPGGKA